ncbi:hypothetical protein DVH24_009786 [Malus domestica]|uniref:F-box domain-containing protein n=1 Tax=Malus domestica TaxID=3750 RepID=A0A498KPV6_MALDO|nr:hypothetical protein DVH24_009786 [Malus domestica]
MVALVKRPKVKEKNGRSIDEKLRENIIKGDCCSSVDRISELPHEIIVSILSLMSLKEAAATSILSRRWRYVWASTMTLVFDSSEFDANGTRSSGFSRAAGGAPDTARRAVLFQPLDPTSG